MEEIKFEGVAPRKRGAKDDTDDGREARLAAMEARIDEKLARLESATALPDDDPHPVYMVTGPGNYFSRDCVLYPPGTKIRDKRGDMPLNQELVPLNKAAHDAMTAYLATLPDGGILSPTERDELIPQAQIELRDDKDKYASKRQFNIACMKRALEIKAAREGYDPNDVMPKMPEMPDPNVPMMGHVRISSNTGFVPADRLFPQGARHSVVGSETEIVRG